jgi:hypothetical protein
MILVVVSGFYGSPVTPLAFSGLAPGTNPLIIAGTTLTLAGLSAITHESVGCLGFTSCKQDPTEILVSIRLNS